MSAATTRSSGRRLTRLRGQSDHALLGAGLLLPAASSTVAVLVTSAVLGPDGRGQIAFMLTSVTIAMTFSSFGLFVVAARSVRAIPRASEGALALLNLIMCGVIMCMGLVAGSGPLTPTVALVISAGAAATAVTVFAQRILQARVSAQLYFVLAALPSLGLLLATGCVWVWPTVPVFASVWLVSMILVACWAVWILHRRVDFEGPFWRGVGATLRGAWPVAFSLISTMLLYRASVVILGFVSTFEQVGYFSFSIAIAGLLWFPAEVVGLKAVALRAQVDSWLEYRSRVSRYAQIAAIIALVGAVALAIGGWLLVPILLPSFTPALLSLVILLMAAVPTSWARVIMMAAGMTKDNRILVLYSWLGLSLTALLVPASYVWGANGAAAASLLIYSVSSLPFILWVRRRRPHVDFVRTAQRDPGGDLKPDS